MAELLVDRDGKVVRMTLNRPRVRNALSVCLCKEMLAALDEISVLSNSDDVRAVVVEAAGPDFCAGADLKERATMNAAEMSEHSRLIAACADKLHALPCPSIACVRGAALGGGFELTLACDIRVVASTASFGFPEVTYGFFPGAGGPVRLTSLVGFSRARFLLLTGHRVTGEEAVRHGIAHLTALETSVESMGLGLADQLATYPPGGVRALRRLLGSLHGEESARGMQLARKLRDELNHDADVQLAMRSFNASEAGI